MYRIIDRGGKQTGPRRSFLFVEKFGRNIDIPMAYGVDTSDPNLRLFMNSYISVSGSKDLVCYLNYDPKTSKCDDKKINSIFKF